MTLEEILKDVPQQWQAPLIKFIKTGTASPDFEQKLETVPELKVAVNKAMMAADEGLGNLGKILERAKAGDFTPDEASFELPENLTSESLDI